VEGEEEERLTDGAASDTEGPTADVEVSWRGKRKKD